MSRFDEITTLQYMGSKTRILEYVCGPIIESNDIKTVIDLFAGTGTVGYALKPYFSVISNDLEYYSYILNEGILNGCQLNEAETDYFNRILQATYQDIKDLCPNALIKEQKFFDDSQIDFLEYRQFCEDTPSIISCGNDSLLYEIEELVLRVRPGLDKQDFPLPILFLTYYANTYFGIRQCCEIDAIRGSIEKISSTRVQNVLLAALMTVMSGVASTTTHFAQYLKVNNKTTCKNLISKRKISIIGEFKLVLEQFREKGLLSKEKNEVRCMNLDYLEVLNNVTLDESVMVYADPPYFKEHYSRYYHVLNTLCKYDYPNIALNPQTKDYSIGRYRINRNISDFGKRSTALMAFKEMINICAKSKASITISYSDNSIVEITEILNVMNKHYSVDIIKIPLKHSKQGRTSTSSVEEYVLIGKPIDMQNVIGQKQVQVLLEHLISMKPIVDNLAGFMHNYMARKPYNIVNEIIKQLSPEGGVVYDPMCGSGTTLIEASKLGRIAIGTDINPLAYKICKVSLSDWNLDRIHKLINDFYVEVEGKCQDLYSYIEENEIRVIERCHFDKIGDELIPTSYWYKVNKQNNLSGRKKSKASLDFIENYRQYKNIRILNVPNSMLIPNSRIAIKNEATVFDYFCNRNLSALDIIIEELKKKSNEYGYDVLELLVSSAINLIKLSDKKASSQMPYWTPQKDVTSRNAIMILKQKKDKFLEGLSFLEQYCQSKVVGSFEEALSKNGSIIGNRPAQNIPYSILPIEIVDLVVTDPPYTDQVPYLEYSQLWSAILGWQKQQEKGYENELVVSDAPSRNKDINDFNKTFESILRRTSKSLKSGGHFVMFYHSFNLKSWDHILKVMSRYGFAYQGQAAIAAPRKSFKTIMSPKSTLDGNYVIVFRKRNIHPQSFDGTINAAETCAVNCAREIISSRNITTSQDLYDRGMLKDAIEKGYLCVLAEKYDTFIDVILPHFNYINGIWEEKGCTGY